ncbi:DSBA oxidoreductase [Pseudomonas sp. M47T1]|uniref:2-hydroxychromene-2-carboxylate isomerase n=1 Tax=Pseudomonas sp. M47T1 TaxID=1179778 RepID=UPI0002606891|nr:2-hydroxychromene-2-carboxylate isomerase [Pseudomonas sp. M47T1]EIK94653.1 DSBA oxidoreductase [Pseudomonas sp. M47T1]
MSKTVEFYFDLGSPASYLAWTQLPGICADTGGQLVYRPILLGGVFKATGNASPAAIPAKGRYMNRDLQRYAARYQVPLRFSSHFPINTLPLMRMITGVQMHQPDRFISLLECLFSALWVDGLNLGDPAVVQEAVEAAGFDTQALQALVLDEGVKDRLKATTEQALQRGVFGAPSLFVDEELYFGQDRLEFVREALLRNG